MSDLDNYFSQQDEIKILTNQVDMIANFYRKFYKDKIAKLEKQSASYRAGKSQAITSRNKAVTGKESLVKSLLRLVLVGRIDLENEEIADICFVTKQSVTNHKSRLKKATQ